MHNMTMPMNRVQLKYSSNREELFLCRLIHRESADPTVEQRALHNSIEMDWKTHHPTRGLLRMRAELNKSTVHHYSIPTARRRSVQKKGSLARTITTITTTTSPVVTLRLMPRKLPSTLHKKTRASILLSNSYR